MGNPRQNRRPLRDKPINAILHAVERDGSLTHLTRALNSGVLRKMDTLNRKDSIRVGMVGATTPTPGTKTSVIQELLGNVGRYNPMSNMSSTFGGSQGPLGNQGTGNGGAGNTLP